MRDLEAGVGDGGDKEGPETHRNHEGKRKGCRHVNGNIVVQLNQQSMFEKLGIM